MISNLYSKIFLLSVAHTFSHGPSVSGAIVQMCLPVEPIATSSAGL